MIYIAVLAIALFYSLFFWEIMNLNEKHSEADVHSLLKPTN